MNCEKSKPANGFAPPGPNASAPEAVVLLALLLVGEHGVGLGDLLELVLRFLVPLVLVGVELLREIAIRLLDLGLGRGLLHAEDLVVVLLGHRAKYTYGESLRLRERLAASWKESRTDRRSRMYGTLARRNVLTMILAGGQGERLFPLTKDRAKPAVPFGGRYRIIDFVINNFINSGFFKIKVLTQFKSNSLIEHITRTWRLVPEIGQYVDVVPAQMRTRAVLVPRHGRRRVPEPRADLRRAAGVRLRLRRRSHLQDGCEPDAAGAHRQRRRPDHRHDPGAGRARRITSASWRSTTNCRVTGFVEKPKDGAKTIPGRPDMILASMGNYIFKANVMIDVLQRNALRNSGVDFGKEIIPEMYPSDRRSCAYDFATNYIPGEDAHQPGLLARRRDGRLVLRGGRWTSWP